MSVEVQSWVDKRRGIGDVRVGSLTGITPVAVELVWAATFNVQASEERDGVLSLTFGVVHALGRSIAVHATRERWAIRAQWALLRGGSRVDEAAALSIWAASSDPEGATDLRLVLGVARHRSDILGTVCKLALDTIPAALLLLPVAANLSLVKTDFPVVSAWSADKKTLSLVDQMRERHLWLRVGIDLPLGGGWNDRLWGVHRVGGGRRHGGTWWSLWGPLRVKAARSSLLEEW